MRIANIASTALSVFSLDMMVHANNLANVNTNGFQPQRLDLADRGANGGVAVGTVTNPGSVLGGTDATLPSETDVARELTGMIGTEHAFAANAIVVRAYDELSGTIMDMVV